MKRMFESLVVALVFARSWHEFVRLLLGRE